MCTRGVCTRACPTVPLACHVYAPLAPQHWKEVKHDHTVTWLAYWKDTISSKDYK